jgi:hypothetical protein
MRKQIVCSDAGYSSEHPWDKPYRRAALRLCAARHIAKSGNSSACQDRNNFAIEFADRR